MIAKGMAPAAPEVMLRVSGSFVIGDMRDRHRDMERLRETDTWRETEAEMEAEKPRHSYRREAGEETQRRSAESDGQGAGVWRRHGKMQRRGAGVGRERGSGPPLTRTGAFVWITKGPPSWGPVTPSAGSFRAVHSLPRSPEQPEPSLSRSLRQPARARRRVGADNRPWHKRTELGMTEPGRAPQGEQEREGDRQAAGLRQGVWAPAVSGPHRPPLGTAWIYCHPGRVPLTFWEREPGGQPRREAAPPQDASGPGESRWLPSLTRNSLQPRLAPGVEPGAWEAPGWEWGAGFPQSSFASQRREAAGLGSPKIGVKGKAFLAEGTACAKASG